MKHDDFLLKSVDFCVQRPTTPLLATRAPRATVNTNDGFCIKNDESCIKNEELCIKNDKFCSGRCVRQGSDLHYNDELFIQNDGLLTFNVMN